MKKYDVRKVKLIFNEEEKNVLQKIMFEVWNLTDEMSVSRLTSNLWTDAATCKTPEFILELPIDDWNRLVCAVRAVSHRDSEYEKFRNEIEKYVELK